MELAICKTEFKAVDGSPNLLTGYGAIFGNVDSYGDVIEPGAFKKTIKERVPNGDVKFLLNHDWFDVGAIAGTVVEASEDDYGLRFTAELSDAPSIQDAKVKMVEGHITDLSIGYNTIRERFPDEPDQKIYRYLEEVKLFEISAVTMGANDKAKILSVKSLHDFAGLPIAPEDYVWQPIEAQRRVAEWSGKSRLKLSRAYLMDGQFLIADIIGNKLTVVPQALKCVEYQINKLTEHIHRYSVSNRAAEPGEPLTKTGSISEYEYTKRKLTLGVH